MQTILKDIRCLFQRKMFPMLFELRAIIIEKWVLPPKVFVQAPILQLQTLFETCAVCVQQIISPYSFI